MYVGISKFSTQQIQSTVTHSPSSNFLPFRPKVQEPYRKSTFSSTIFEVFTEFCLYNTVVSNGVLVRYWIQQKRIRFQEIPVLFDICLDTLVFRSQQSAESDGYTGRNISVCLFKWWWVLLNCMMNPITLGIWFFELLIALHFSWRCIILNFTAPIFFFLFMEGKNTVCIFATV